LSSGEVDREAELFEIEDLSDRIEGAMTLLLKHKKDKNRDSFGVNFRYAVDARIRRISGKASINSSYE